MFAVICDELFLDETRGPALWSWLPKMLMRMISVCMACAPFALDFLKLLMVCFAIVCCATSLIEKLFADGCSQWITSFFFWIGDAIFLVDAIVFCWWVILPLRCVSWYCWCTLPLSLVPIS